MTKTPAQSKSTPAAARRGTPPPRKPRLAAGDTGCKFVAEWKLLTSTARMTQIWIPTKEYKRVAAALLKLTQSEVAKANLRARRATIGVTHACKGTCGGGWCKEVEIPQPGASLVTVCECAYFV